jgi:hypothetical protein
MSHEEFMAEITAMNKRLWATAAEMLDRQSRERQAVEEDAGQQSAEFITDEAFVEFLSFHPELTGGGREDG